MQLADGVDLGAGPARGVGNCIQHVGHPFDPGAVAGDGQQQAVVVGLALDDVARQVQHRMVQQFLLYQHQQVEHAAGAAVAVGEGMDGLELVVRHRHADQRIDIALLMDEALPVGELVAQQYLTGSGGRSL